MALSLTNSKDIVANNVTVVKGSRAIDLIDTIEAVQGFAPEALNSLEKLATALNNDNNFFSSITAAIDNKQAKINLGTSITGSQSLLNTTTSKLKILLVLI